MDFRALKYLFLLLRLKIGEHQNGFRFGNGLKVFIQRFGPHHFDSVSRRVHSIKNIWSFIRTGDRGLGFQLAEQVFESLSRFLQNSLVHFRAIRVAPYHIDPVQARRSVLYASQVLVLLLGWKEVLHRQCGSGCFQTYGCTSWSTGLDFSLPYPKCKPLL